MKIACIQITSGDDVAANIAQIAPLVAQAAGRGAELIALPENAFYMQALGKDPHPDPLPGRERGKWTQAAHPGVAAAAGWAKQHKVWVLVGSVSVVPDTSPQRGEARRGADLREQKLSSRTPRPHPNPPPQGEGIKTYNRSLLFNPQGEIAAQYDKIHLFDVEVGDGQAYKESAKILPGDKAVVAELTPTPTLPLLGGGNITLGMTVCYDVRFPHLYRALAQAGAQILAVPAAFTQVTGEAHWHVLLRARAIENGCFVIAPAQTGTHPGERKTFGHSLIIDPWGRVLADGGTDVGVVLADIDLGEVEKARKKIPSLEHDREFLLSS